MNDRDNLSATLAEIGAQFEYTRITAAQAKRDQFPPTARRGIVLDTTTFIFDANGRYLGREYMGRDECDRFRARQ